MTHRFTSEVSTWAPRALATWVLLLGVLTAVFAWLFVDRVKDYQLSVQSEQKVALEAIKASVDAQLLNAIDNLSLTLNNADRTRFSDEPTEANRQAYIEFLKDVLSSKLHLLTQVQYLDLSGRELLRVQTINRRPEAVPEEALKQKVKETYVASILSLTGRQIFMSRMRLPDTTEVVEYPPTPYMYFGRIAYDSSGSPVGMVVVKISAGILIENILSTVEGSAFNTWMLNSAGEWVLGPRPENDYYLHDDKGRIKPFKDSFPELWYRIEDIAQGEALISNNTEKHIYGIGKPNSRSTYNRFASLNSKIISKESLTVVTMTDAGAVQAVRQGIIHSLAIPYVIFAIILAVLSYFVSRAISHRNSVVAEIVRREQDFQSLLESAPDAMLVVDDSGRIILANERAEHLFRYERADLQDLLIEQLIPARYRDNHSIYRQVFTVNPKARAMGEGRQLTALRADGTEVPVTVALSSFESSIGKRVACSVRDISNERKIAEDLMESQRAAELASEAKSQFLASVSQEIRTPLNSIIGTAYLMAQSDLPDEQRQDVENIAGASKVLLNLVNEVLDFSQLEAQEIVLNPKRFDPLILLNEIEQIFAVQVIEKNLTLEVHHPGNNFPKAFIGDDGQLTQMLINLVGNAIKHTSQGQIDLQMKLTHLNEQQQAKVRFVVACHDQGANNSDSAGALAPLMTTGSEPGQVIPGSGLGLSIVKRVATLMGGTAGIEFSDIGEATFWFEILLTVPSGEWAPEAMPKPDEERLQVLLAEDNDLQRHAIESMCQRFGWEVESVANGKDLIQRVLARLRSGKQIDCLLVDWRMPQLDGLSALQELRGTLGDTRMPSVIMITAREQEMYARMRPDVRPNATLTKPLEPSSLFNAVEEAAREQGYDPLHIFNSTDVDTSHAAWLSDLRVMIVDDVSINLKVASRILESEGAIVSSFLSGQEAIRAIEANPDDFDIILMDLQMPGKNGFDTTLHIRERLAWLRPIIALTAGATATERQRALASGMDDFLIKPFDPSSLVTVLRNHGTKVRGTDWPIVSKQSVGLTNYASEEWPTLPGIDAKENRKLMLNDRALLRESLGDALNKLNEQTIVFREAYTLHDLDPLRQSAHVLAGLAANLAATTLHEASAQLERAIVDKVEYLDQYIALELATGELKRSIEQYLNIEDSNQEGSTQS